MHQTSMRLLGSHIEQNTARPACSHDQRPIAGCFIQADVCFGEVPSTLRAIGLQIFVDLVLVESEYMSCWTNFAYITLHREVMRCYD